jgi:predicted thioesterase
MKNPFSIGDVKVFRHVVTAEDTARFQAGEVHAVYSTFALARDAEWSGRLFVLEMKDADEEGIGTGISVAHHAPALIGQEVVFTATLTDIIRNEIITTYEARVDDKIIATGEQRQKMMKKEKLNRLFD